MQHFSPPPEFENNDDYEPPRSPIATLRDVLIHVFIITLEATLLIVQYFRMEVLAFDLLPEIADIELGPIYGSQLMGGLWVMIVIFVSYATWEVTIRLNERGSDSSVALRAAGIVFWIMNLAAMVFEYVLFTKLVDDLASLGIPGAAELFGGLMVAVHQVSSLWLMKNVVRQMFVNENPEA